MLHSLTRPSELRLAQWNEFDWDNAVWSIPAGRMKMAREHLVPLSEQVATILRELRQFAYGDYLFPSIRSKTKVIADATALFALRRMGYTQQEATLHGFRTTASTLLNELGFRSDIIEAQLAHRDKNKVRAAYLWVNGLQDAKNAQTIYVATEAGMPIMEAGRFNAQGSRP